MSLAESGPAFIPDDHRRRAKAFEEIVDALFALLDRPAYRRAIGDETAQGLAGIALDAYLPDMTHDGYRTPEQYLRKPHLALIPVFSTAELSDNALVRLSDEPIGERLMSQRYSETHGRIIDEVEIARQIRAKDFDTPPLPNRAATAQRPSRALARVIMGTSIAPNNLSYLVERPVTAFLLPAIMDERERMITARHEIGHVQNGLCSYGLVMSTPMGKVSSETHQYRDDFLAYRELGMQPTSVASASEQARLAHTTPEAPFVYSHGLHVAQYMNGVLPR